MITLVSIAVVLVSTLVIYFHRIYSRFSRYGVKHLSVIPPLGNLIKPVFGREHLITNYEKLYKAFPEERFVGRYELTQPVILLRDLDLIKKVAIKDFENFIDRRGFTHEDNEPIIGRNLFGLKGQEWKDMRATLSPSFTSSKIKLMIPFMEEIGEQMMKTLTKMINESKGKTIEMSCEDLTTRYATDVIASCMYGLKVDSLTDRDNEFYMMGYKIAKLNFQQMLVLLFTSAFPSLGKTLKISLLPGKAKEYFFKLVTQTIKQRDEHKIVRPDMLHLLMETRKGRYNDKQGNPSDEVNSAPTQESLLSKKTIVREWTDDDLVAQAVVFFLAGFETVSTTMTFTLHELALHPDVQERLVQEIREHHAKLGDKFDYSSILNLTYLDMVVSETLRRWSTLAFLERVCVKDYNLGKPNDKSTQDYIIRKGETVFIPLSSIHRDPEYYPNPEKFDPERFSPSNKHQINPIAYMPFGVGPRNCIGNRFALCEVKIFLYQFLLHFEVSTSPRTCNPLRLRPDRFTPVIQGGSWLQFKLRDHADAKQIKSQ